jgi:tryptophan 2,3-dioxygenase
MAQKIEYSEYLKLGQLLNCAEPRSYALGRPSHDEMLFITVHHSYEIWFKQLLFEVDSMLTIFAQPKIQEREMGILVSRLQRMVEILKVLVHQVDVLETMTPLDFLEFRDLLYPASGFQSLQFRLFENKLGLKSAQRMNYNSLPYHQHLAGTGGAQARASEEQPTLFECLEKWLERTPFLQTDSFDFWTSYRQAVEENLNEEDRLMRENTFLTAEEKAKNLEISQRSREAFLSLFDDAEYAKQRADGSWRLSYKAIHAALLIQLYRDEPIFQLPFRVLTAVLDLDALLTQWRYRHAIMAQRMLGHRVGTGGSSGATYLKQSAEQHRIFTDFYRLTTFFLPRSKLPVLPPEMRRSLGFSYSDGE